MLLRLFALAIGSIAIQAAPYSTLAHLPNAQVNAAKTDSAGNIYFTGFQGTQPNAHAFVTKLNAAGTVLYSITFAGSNNDVAVAIDLDSTGAAYIGGYTTSPDFPVTAGALQTALQSSYQGFVVKVDPTGTVIYSTFIGGSAQATPGGGGLVVDSLGEVFVSGHTFGTGFPSVANSAFNSTDINTTFLMKLDAAGGKLLGEVRGIGGLIALDGQSNVYVAGVQGSTATFVPATAGAFQGSFQFNACGGDAQVAFACPYQYVTKLDPALSTILYSTYLNGSFGATPSGIAVDAEGEAFVAGSTNSRDYPTTSNAFLPTFIANAPNPTYVCLFFCVFPPPTSGYVTKLNSTGTGLIYSTYFSGTQTDTIALAFFTTSGIYLSGNAGSSDLPGFDGYPSQCLPQPYAVRLSADATEVGASRVAPGGALAYDSASGELLVWTGTDLLAFDPAAPPPAIGCILDSADLKPVTSIAPGQLLTLFGRRL